MADHILRLPNDETIIGLLETVESEEHESGLPKELQSELKDQINDERDSMNFVCGDNKLKLEDASHEDESLIPPQTVKSEEILCKEEMSGAEPILTMDMRFESVSEVESFMSKYMNFTKSAFVKSSHNARQVNNIKFAV